MASPMVLRPSSAGRQQWRQANACFRVDSWQWQVHRCCSSRQVLRCQDRAAPYTSSAHLCAPAAPGWPTTAAHCLRRPLRCRPLERRPESRFWQRCQSPAAAALPCTSRSGLQGGGRAYTHAVLCVGVLCCVGALGGSWGEREGEQERDLRHVWLGGWVAGLAGLAASPDPAMAPSIK